MNNTVSEKPWHFVHSEAAEADWAQGMRAIFEYRDLAIVAGTNGDYVAHVIRARGSQDGDQIHQWQEHDCCFQMVYILKGWATFEYAGIGFRTLRAGDCINQVPLLKHREVECSADLEIPGNL